MKTQVARFIQADKTAGKYFFEVLKVIYGVGAFWGFYAGLFHFQDQHTELLAKFWSEIGTKYGADGMKISYIFIIKYVCLAFAAISFLLIPLRKIWHLTALLFLSLILWVIP